MPQWTKDYHPTSDRAIAEACGRARVLLANNKDEWRETEAVADVAFDMLYPYFEGDLENGTEDVDRLYGAFLLFAEREVDAAMRRREDHRYSADLDRCVCGGVVVYFEPDDAGVFGEGCEVSGHVW